MEEIHLGESKEDQIVKVLRTIATTIPYAGNIITELIETVIPNQRIDRIEKYIKILVREIEEINEEKLELEMEKEECIDLFEESFIQASRTITNERREYIAKIVKNGIEDEKIEYIDSKYIMRIIQELNDNEIIWLRFYLNSTIGGDEEFRNKHNNILQPITATLGADEETLNKKSIQDSYKDHLQRLNLVTSHIKINKDTGLPVYDKIKNEPKERYKSITNLGRLVLEQIGLYDNEIDPLK